MLQFFYDWSDRKIIEHARYNIVVKWFLELGVDEEPFDFTALCKFRARLGVKLHFELFRDILGQIDAAGFLDFRDQFIDATSILGDAAVCSTIQLISKACTHVARKLEEEGHPVSFEEEKKSVQKIAEKAFDLLETAEDIPGAEHEREIFILLVSESGNPCIPFKNNECRFYSFF